MPRSRRWSQIARHMMQLCSYGWVGGGYVPYEYFASRVIREMPHDGRSSVDRQKDDELLYYNKVKNTARD